MAKKTLNIKLNEIYEINKAAQKFEIDWANTSNFVSTCCVNDKYYYLYLIQDKTNNIYICTGVHCYFDEHKEISLDDLRNILYHIK